MLWCAVVGVDARLLSTRPQPGGVMSRPKMGSFEMLAIIEECEGGAKAVGE